MNDEKKKRQRGPNYTSFEKALIVSLADENRQIIENKRNDGTTNRLKERAWEDIARKFNEACPAGQLRTAYSIQKWYVNKKKEAKQIHQQQAIVSADRKVADGADRRASGFGTDQETEDGRCAEMIPEIVIDESEISLGGNERTFSVDNVECPSSGPRKKGHLTRKRPTVAQVQVSHSARMTKIYESIARAKLDLVNVQRAQCEEEHREKMAENKLRQVSLQLDIAIKKAKLELLQNGNNNGSSLSD